MDFVTCAANIRAHIFSIPLRSRFDVKGLCESVSFQVNIEGLRLSRYQVYPFSYIQKCTKWMLAFEKLHLQVSSLRCRHKLRSSWLVIKRVIFGSSLLTIIIISLCEEQNLNWGLHWYVRSSHIRILSLRRFTTIHKVPVCQTQSDRFLSLSLCPFSHGWEYNSCHCHNKCYYLWGDCYAGLEHFEWKTGQV